MDMGTLCKPTSHCSSLLALKIGAFRLRSSKEESASCEEMALRNGLNSVSYHDPILEPTDIPPKDSYIIRIFATTCSHCIDIEVYK